MKEDTAQTERACLFCGLCQNNFSSVYPDDVICPECENGVTKSSDWITGVFGLYQDSDFESLMLLIPRIRKQLKFKAEKKCHEALEAYQNGNLAQASFLWEEARRYDSKNIQAAFNLAYMQLKSGVIDYADFISHLSDLEDICLGHAEYQEFITRLKYGMSQAEDIDNWLPLSSPKKVIKPKPIRKPAFSLALTLKAHQGFVSAVKFSDDGNYLMTASHDGRISFWDVWSQKELQRFTFEHAQIAAACLTPDGTGVFAATDDYVLHLLDLNTGETVRQFKGHRALPVWVGVTPYGRLALSGSWDGTIGFWDLKKPRPMNLYPAQIGPINNMWMSSDGMCLLLTGLKREFRMLDLSGEMDHRWLGLPGQWPFSICSADDKRYALCGHTDGSISLWNLNYNQHLKTLTGHKGMVKQLVMDRESRYALSLGSDQTARVWDLNKGTEIYKIAQSNGQMSCIGVAPNNNSFITAGDDGLIKIWVYC
jgi:hypothetical protein